MTCCRLSTRWVRRSAVRAKAAAETNSSANGRFKTPAGNEKAQALRGPKRRSLSASYRMSSEGGNHQMASKANDEGTLMVKPKACSLLILGSGVAGLTAALEAADLDCSVVVVTKSDVYEGSTKYAQGGVAAVMDTKKTKSGVIAEIQKLERDKEGDSVSHHVEDTMNAGCYLNDREAVEIMCREGPSQVKMLCKIGVPFTTKGSRTQVSSSRPKDLHLGKEGGHSHSRVVHAADTTGAAMMKALVVRVREHPNITVHENMFALDLITVPSEDGAICCGCDTIDLRTGAYRRFVSKCTVVATGGCGQIYPETTNPSVATGDGIAMAARAGAEVNNMEFIQFHPTSLYVGNQEQGEEALNSVFLISEAVRGAGAILRNAKGESFMSKYDVRADLAPRDIVARGIYDQMRLHDTSHVYLDATCLSREEARKEFPNISNHVESTLGIDMSEDWIPVVPAQHYACGGILTSIDGETNVKGLYAIGEAACTGVHGANRLASNSLLEGLVFGKRSVMKSMEYMQSVPQVALSDAEHAKLSSLRFFHDADISKEGPLCYLDDDATFSLMSAIQEIMWEHAGILRNDNDLSRGLEKVKVFKSCLEGFKGCSSMQHAQLINMATVAQLVLEGAVRRKRSAGLHHNVDRPEKALAEARSQLDVPSLEE
ncbi:L-aspartate oxidase [Chloropicon primus]|uniref:L-aspartate oxidase n=1 Tax=Chloropicon primus TaxID=1764295 RepID=A0A5B8N2H4_9CHLO|nr:L-aspartate oxidase [Chloropicon primus]|mmetsp:Transcript_2192/g.5978  ORF Transcript_2192/g.5978 Transcript_2192/m.5978 type:complete len:658 (+) Transcript_2192:379-2352(+)|eukprot:QDZ26070.1 L-aspartate oxidase [Chloropicon primus]